jgi:hypothetical protein
LRPNTLCLPETAEIEFPIPQKRVPLHTLRTHVLCSHIPKLDVMNTPIWRGDPINISGGAILETAPGTVFVFFEFLFAKRKLWN